MQPIRRWVAFGIAALVVGGCGGNDGAAPATSLVTGVTSAVETTEVTTPASTSSTSTTVAATTTLPATTTTVATEDLIKKAVQDYLDGYHQCGAAPANCVAANFTAEAGHSRSTIAQLATDMTQNGLYFLQDTRGSYAISESISYPSSSEASAIYCVFDALAVMGPIGPDGAPTAVDDRVVSLTNDYRLFLEHGTWRVGEQLKLEDLGDGNLCPPAG